MNPIKVRPDGRLEIITKHVRCIFPKGTKIAYLGAVGKTLIGRSTPAITYGGTIHFNKDIIALCTPETMVHESVHIFQERRMSKLDYWFTYLWHILISLFRVGPSHIHDDHLMEREARNIAQAIVKDSSSYTRTISPNTVGVGNVYIDELDIEALIKKHTGW